MTRCPLIVLIGAALITTTACPPPCPETARPRCTACPPGAQRPPTKPPECVAMCQYFTHCRARRWTSPTHLAKLVAGCTKQCQTVKPGSEAAKIFAGIKQCSVNRSCVDLVSCLESLEAKLRAERPKVDPDAIYRVPVGSSPTQGPATAVVTLVMFADHQCGFCRRGYRVVKAALKKHGASLRLVYKHFPLSDHAEGALSARVAACVHHVKGAAAFWTFHDKAMTTEDLSKDAMDKLAKTAGANAKALAKCAGAKRGLATVKADLVLGTALGIDGTPTFYVNGKRYAGYLDAAALDRAIAEARTRAKAALAAGVKPAAVYDHLTSKGATQLQYLPRKRATPPPRR